MWAVQLTAPQFPPLKMRMWERKKPHPRGSFGWSNNQTDETVGREKNQVYCVHTCVRGPCVHEGARAPASMAALEAQGNGVREAPPSWVRGGTPWGFWSLPDVGKCRRPMIGGLPYRTGRSERATSDTLCLRARPCFQVVVVKGKHRSFS